MIHALIAALVGPLAIAAQWSCAPESWVQPPTVVHGQFVGALTAECVVEGADKGGFPALQKHLVARTLLGQVHDGPIEEVLEGLSGVKYDVTENLSKKGSLLVRGWIHIATDQTTRLLYEGRSTEVQASGMAGYLKTLNILLDLHVNATTAGTYSVTLRTEFAFARPWYVPSGLFKIEADRIGREKFNASKKTVMPEILENI